MPPPEDRRRIDRLVVEQLPAALRLARRLTGSGDAAEDLVQEAMRRVLDRWQTYRGDASFKTWLLRIVINADRDRRRRLRPIELYADDETATPNPEPDQQATANELANQIGAAIDSLPDRQRETALLFFDEGLTADEVARTLETTTSNVHACLYQARKKIAAAIGYEPVRPRT